MQWNCLFLKCEWHLKAFICFLFVRLWSVFFYLFVCLFLFLSNSPLIGFVASTCWYDLFVDKCICFTIHVSCWLIVTSLSHIITYLVAFSFEHTQCVCVCADDGDIDGERHKRHKNQIKWRCLCHRLDITRKPIALRLLIESRATLDLIVVGSDLIWFFFSPFIMIV